MQAGGWDQLAVDLPEIIRRSIDEVIDTPRTNRFTLVDTEKTEKTYLGTKIEILLRSYLKLSKGKKLDLSINGIEVDIKNTMGPNWSIPTEAMDHICILVQEREISSKFNVGLILIREEYLNPGKNKDAKRTISAVGRANIWWLLRDHSYPRNFWLDMPLAQRQAIMAAGRGTKRIAAFFRAIQRSPVSRLVIESIAQQHDSLKRVRKNGGARDILASEGIAILWGKKDKVLINKLGLGLVRSDEFISYQPTELEHINLLKNANHIK